MWGERPWRGRAWGETKSAKMALSGSPAPRFVTDDYVNRGEHLYGTAHARHEVRAWSRATLCCTDVWAPPENWWRSCCVPAVSAGPATSGENTACLLRWPCAGHGRISTSACPTAPLVCFQPLSSWRASPVFNEQCAPFASRIPEDSWRSPTGSEIQLSLSASASYSRSFQYQTC